MKLASFSVDGRRTWGVADDDGLADVGALLGTRYAGLRQVIAADAYDEVRTSAATAPRLDPKAVEFLPVVSDPGKIICIGLNYETHRVETGREKSGYPAVFLRFADSQLGHGCPILQPPGSDQLDYEGELAVVIGRGGRRIAAGDALAHVAGYACYNDATLRDWQRHTHQFTPGKNFPETGGFGPWLVTTDEIPDPTALRLTTRVNGAVVQDAGLDQLIFSIPELIEYCSGFTPLAPGDVIVTGTPGGVGFKREPPLFLHPGDTVEVDIPGVGLLVNGVAQESA